MQFFHVLQDSISHTEYVHYRNIYFLAYFCLCPVKFYSRIFEVIVAAISRVTRFLCSLKKFCDIEKHSLVYLHFSEDGFGRENQKFVSSKISLTKIKALLCGLFACILLPTSILKGNNISK